MKTCKPCFNRNEVQLTKWCVALFAAGGVAHASTDYGPAIWTPPCNANYYTSGYGHKFHVIHDMEGFYGSVVSFFAQCSTTDRSVHYLVNSGSGTSAYVPDWGATKTDTDGKPAGEVTQMIRDSMYSWHALCWNQHATGTEHEGFASSPAWYTEAQYVASAGITKHVSQVFGWAKDRNHVVGHDNRKVAGWASWASANLGIDPWCNTHNDPGPYWDWNHYMALVGNAGLVGGPDACSWGANRIDVFARGSDNALWHKWYDNGTWFSWQSLGGVINSDPTAVSWGNGRIDVFARGGNNNLFHIYYQNGWSGWENLGGTLTSGPDACSWGSGRIDVFMRGSNNNLYQLTYNNGWQPWANLGGTLYSDPTATSWGAGRIDVFWRGSAGDLQHRWLANNAWSASESLGGGTPAGPDACSQGSGKLDVFVRGNDNALYQRSYSNGAWGGWVNLGGTLAADPSACTWGAGIIDVFGNNGDCYHKWYRNGWGSWETLGQP